MDWGDLRVFLTAVRAGSYTGASRDLGINRTTVGRRIEVLEAAIGRPLFQKTSLGYTPTAAGSRLLVAAETIERAISDMVVSVGTDEQMPAPVRIAGSAGIASEFLPEIMIFRQRNPDIAVELSTDLDPIDAVTQRRADLAIALIPAPPRRLTGMAVATLSQARYGLRSTTDLPPLGWGSAIEAALPGSSWTASNPIGDAAMESGFSRCNSWSDLKAAVTSGLGSAMLWCFSADSIAAIERLSVPDPRYDSPLWLLRHAKTPPTPSTARLMAHLSQAIAHRLAAVNDRQEND